MVYSNFPLIKVQFCKKNFNEGSPTAHIPATQRDGDTSPPGALSTCRPQPLTPASPGGKVNPWNPMAGPHPCPCAQRLEPRACAVPPPRPWGCPGRWRPPWVGAARRAAPCVCCCSAPRLWPPTARTAPVSSEGNRESPRGRVGAGQCPREGEKRPAGPPLWVSGSLSPAVFCLRSRCGRQRFPFINLFWGVCELGLVWVVGTVELEVGGRAGVRGSVTGSIRHHRAPWFVLLNPVPYLFVVFSLLIFTENSRISFC